MDESQFEPVVSEAGARERYDDVVIATDIYRPDEWHDFFLMVGGAAAVLAGLVFVALFLNLDAVMRDPTHRFRAIGTLANFVGIFTVRTCTDGWAGP